MSYARERVAAPAKVPLGELARMALDTLDPALTGDAIKVLFHDGHDCGGYELNKGCEACDTRYAAASRLRRNSVHLLPEVAVTAAAF